VYIFRPILGSHDPKQNICSEAKSDWQIRLRKKYRTAANYLVNYLKLDNKRYLKKKQMSMLNSLLKNTDKTYRMWVQRFRVQGSGFIGFVGFRVRGCGLRVTGYAFRVTSYGMRVTGSKVEG
jgi:hypothetical protein